MKFIRLLLPFLLIALSSSCFAQSTHSQSSSGGDLAHSVFGPPIKPTWEFQLGYSKEDGENISSFNFYRKDQRNKTLFFRVADNILNSRNEFRVKEITGGAILFPVNDDDRFQVDLGGTYDVAKGTSLSGKSIFTRVTYRPQSNIWLRAGSEYFDGYTLGHSYRKTILNSNYLVGKYSISSVSVIGLVGNGKIDYALNTRFGFAGIFEGPFSTFALAGYIKSEDEKENVRTLAVGRAAPFRPDGLPSAVFIWKHKNNYDFQLGGVFWGGQNLFVRPAAIGMTQGMFISSTALRENSKLRQGQLMNITDDYRNAEMTLFYVYLNQAIEIMPGTTNHVGFRAIQFFKIFSDVKFSILSKPVIGVFYNEETEPGYNPLTRKFVDDQTTFWTFQAGLTFDDRFVLNVIHTPDKAEWNFALSFLLLPLKNTEH
jgi:hypothetical protein